MCNFWVKSILGTFWFDWNWLRWFYGGSVVTPARMWRNGSLVHTASCANHLSQPCPSDRSGATLQPKYIIAHNILCLSNICTVSVTYAVRCLWLVYWNSCEPAQPITEADSSDRRDSQYISTYIRCSNNKHCVPKSPAPMSGVPQDTACKSKFSKVWFWALISMKAELLVATPVRSENTSRLPVW